MPIGVSRRSSKAIRTLAHLSSGKSPRRRPCRRRSKPQRYQTWRSWRTNQIVAQIQSRFAGHALARLVDAVLQGDGWMTRISVPGPDGGVDILAGRGPLGLDAPRLCVQVKSQNSPADVTVYRTLQGTMQTFKGGAGVARLLGRV